jgi:hypothetical protein
MRPLVRLISLSDWYRRDADPLHLVAPVDYEMDKKIRGTITSEFEDCTILCIAHKSPILHSESENKTL